MSDIPANFIRKGVKYCNAAVRNSIQMSQEMIVGAVDGKILFEMFVQRSKLIEQPVIGEVWQLEEVDGYSFVRVEEVKPSADGLLWTVTMHCSHRNQGVTPTGASNGTSKGAW